MGRFSGCARATGMTTMPEDKLEQARGIITKATATEVSLQLVHHLTEKSLDANALRSQVQIEIRRMRARGLSEKTSLPPAVFKRAHAALLLK